MESFLEYFTFGKCIVIYGYYFLVLSIISCQFSIRRSIFQRYFEKCCEISTHYNFTSFVVHHCFSFVNFFLERSIVGKLLRYYWIYPAKVRNSLLHSIYILHSSHFTYKLKKSWFLYQTRPFWNACEKFSWKSDVLIKPLAKR